MDVDCILNASKATVFMDGELGEVCVRLADGPNGLHVSLVAYAARVLTDRERTILAALRDALKSHLEAIKFNPKSFGEGSHE